jgi:hypothetical protein
LIVLAGLMGVGGVILDYNENDCRAMKVLLDGIRGLSAGNGGS